MKISTIFSLWMKHLRFLKTILIQSKGLGKRKSPPWWNGVCLAAIWKLKAAFKKYRRVTSRANFNNFSKARAEARRAWKTFVDGINEKSTSKIFRKVYMFG